MNAADRDIVEQYRSLARPDDDGLVHKDRVEPLIDLIESQAAEIEQQQKMCNGSCDIALARRQVGPDGIVPGNARECAELWEREASRLAAELTRLREVVERQEDELSWLFKVVTKVRKTSLAWTKHKNLQHAPGHIRNIIYWTEEPCRFAEEAAQAKAAKGVGAKRVAGLSTLPADSEMFSPGDT